MIGRLAALILLGTISMLHTAEVPHLISLTTLELGGNVTFYCPCSEKKDRFVHWYKQSLGKMVQTVATIIYNKRECIDPFNNSRFEVHKTKDQCVLTINHINKEDEATYFCQSGTEFLQHFVRGFFLAVNDYNQQTSVYVKQTPKTSLVPLGDTVTLECSLLTKNKENRTQCPGDHSVHWFKGGSGEHHPSIIYSHFSHRTDDAERRCIYHLSKTMQNSSDAGTYYCAVVTCGQILFGEGSKVETRPDVDPVVFVLGGLLVCCVTVIIILISCITQRSYHFKGAASVSHHLGHRSTAAQPDDLDGEAKDACNYAPLNFSTKKARRGKKETREHTECVYADVNSVDQTEQHPSVRGRTENVFAGPQEPADN